MKKLDELENGGLVAEDKRGNFAHAVHVDADYGTDAHWRISYHQGDMPAHNTECFDSRDELVAVMRNFVNDLRKWRTPEIETIPQTKLNTSLAPGREGERQKASLEWLARKLGFRGVSAMQQRMAQATDTDPLGFAAALETAFAMAAVVEDEA